MVPYDVGPCIWVGVHNIAVDHSSTKKFIFYLGKRRMNVQNRLTIMTQQFIYYLMHMHAYQDVLIVNVKNNGEIITIDLHGCIHMNKNKAICIQLIAHARAHTHTHTHTHTLLLLLLKFCQLTHPEF